VSPKKNGGFIAQKFRIKPIRLRGGISANTGQLSALVVWNRMAERRKRKQVASFFFIHAITLPLKNLSYVVKGVQKNYQFLQVHC
jgi:hypothetical protein